MNEHIAELSRKAEKTVKALSRIMPNRMGPNAMKRKMLAGVIHSTMLYAVGAWATNLTKTQTRK